MGWNVFFTVLGVLGIVLGWISAKPIIWPHVRGWRQRVAQKRVGSVTFKVTNSLLQTPPQEPYFPEAMTFEPNKPYTLSRRQFDDLKKRSVGVQFEVIS